MLEYVGKYRILKFEQVPLPAMSKNVGSVKNSVDHFGAVCVLFAWASEYLGDAKNQQLQLYTCWAY